MSEPPPAPPSWRPDPSGKHAYRYYDGKLWTEHVSDGQTQAIDPLPGPSRRFDAFDLAMMPFSSRQANRRRLFQGMVASPHSGTVIQHFSFAVLLLIGLTLVGAGLLGASCQTRSSAAAVGREAMIAGLRIETISPDAPDAVPAGRLVHVKGVARPHGPVTDDQTGVSMNALVLARTTSMYQWIETCTTHDDRPTVVGRDVYVESDIRWRRRGDLVRWTKCTYTKGWKDEPQAIHPDRADRYRNPPFPLEVSTHRYEPASWALGKLMLPFDDLPGRLHEHLPPIPLAPEHLATLSPELRARTHTEGNALYIGDPKAPKVGDVRITYAGLSQLTLTLIGERTERGLKPHRLPDGTEFFQAREGTFSIEELAGARQQDAGEAIWAHVWFASIVTFGVGLLFLPLRSWGRVLPGPPLLTGAGVLLFVPLAATALYATTLARAWWAPDRDSAVLAAVVAAGACALLLAASAARLLLRRPGNDAG